MEALANRAGILVNGELACLGSVAHLRSVHGQGYLLEVKLGDASSARLDETVRRAAAFLTHNHGEPAGTATATAAAAATKAATPLPWLIRGALGPLVAHLGGDAAAVEASMKPAGAGRGAPRGDEGGPSPSGSALSAAFDTGGGGGGGRISLPLFAAWWEGEAAVGALLAFVLRGAEGPPCLRGARLEEQQGSCLRFRVPAAAPAAAESAADVGAKQQRRVGEDVAAPDVGGGGGRGGGRGSSVASLFAVLEANKTALGMASYSVSQTSLEAIFNAFASSAAAAGED